MAFHGKLPMVPCNTENDGITFWDYGWLVSCRFEMLQVLQSQTRVAMIEENLRSKAGLLRHEDSRDRNFEVSSHPEAW